MKSPLLILTGLFASSLLASAQTTILYQQDWGSTNGPSTDPISLTNVAWSQVMLPGGYSGIYVQDGAHDGDTAEPLPLRTAYFGGNAGVGMFFTTNGAGTGPYGDSAFTSINPALHTNLQISVECQWSWQGGNVRSWFALEVGGMWYVATNNPLSPKPAGTPNNTFYKSTLTYSPLAANWNYLTNGPSVVIGGPAAGNLAGLITGVGIVCQLVNSGSWDFNQMLITSTSNTVTLPPVIANNGWPLSQTVYAGGGVSFAVNANGTQPFSYYWQKDGDPLTDIPGKIANATTRQITILNANAGDAGTYSVIVSNSAGTDTSLNYAAATLAVEDMPANYLYAERFPFVGPNPVGLPITSLGWSNSIPDDPDRLYQRSGGDGAAYAYQAGVATTFFYATTNSDNGVSGPRFPKITPGAHPAVAFSVDIAPSYVPASVSAYCAVQMNGGNWYVNSTPLSVDTSTATGTFTTYQQQFTTLAAQWKNLTFNATGATIGSAAAANLTGDITGAGLVFVHTAAGTFNFDNFLITTDSVAPTPPTITYSPYSQSVYSGAGVSFTVGASGSQPITYYWQKDGLTLNNGSRISGARSNVLTILKVTAGDHGPYSVIASNTAGTDNSLNYLNTSLAVTDPTNGLLYAESFPYIGPGTAAYPLTTIGWYNAIPGSSDRLFQVAAGDGAGYAWQDYSVSTAFFATPASDTGASGLPFAPINTAFYPAPVFLIDIAPSVTPENVTARIVVQMDGGAWYAAATPLPVDTSAATTAFTTYSQVFNPAAANWRTLGLVAGSGATIGDIITWNLTGTITGAGIVVTHTGAGGTFNFDNFYVTSTGIGGINVSTITPTNMVLSWIGNPSVRLQSRASLSDSSSWQDVPNTAGQYSATVPATGQQMFFRLKSP